MIDPAKIGLRKADFWTSILLISLGAGMVLKALSMPLEGNYAGVRNVWYVSPALAPIGVGSGLILLALILLANAVRSGGAAAAIGDLSRISLPRPGGPAVASTTVVGILAAYIYGLVPRTDFIAATALTLFTFTAVFHLTTPRAGAHVLLVAALTALGVVVAAAIGFSPEPRSLPSHLRDALVWAGTGMAMALAAAAVRGDPQEKVRLRHCIFLSLLAPLILGSIFKYGFLSPLPYEGLTAEMLDRIRLAVIAPLTR